MAKPNKRFVTVSFKASREPVDDMFWCEAEYDGAWTNVILLERVKTRREILERIVELESGLVTFDFPFSFPKPFVDFLKTEGIDDSWSKRAERIREDLKKNTDDGIRKWIEYMGKYRESNLESQEESEGRFQRFPVQNRSGSRNPRPLPPHELRSKAERFRRIDMILRRRDEGELESVLGIRYNKLTSRYEFTSSEARGRAALVGISLLQQIREQKEDAAIWPFMKPDKLTITEVDPRLFPRAPKAQDLQKFFDTQEDSALFIDRSVKDIVGSNPLALNLLFTLLGTISAERRENKTIRPLRDYRDSFYENEEVRAEGWAYGIGFKEAPKEVKQIHIEAAPKEKVVEAAKETQEAEQVEQPIMEEQKVEPIAEMIEQPVAEPIAEEVEVIPHDEVVA